MCNAQDDLIRRSKTVPVTDAVGMVIAHDITEIRPGEFKGRAFKKGHIVREEDIEHLQRLGKEHLFILEIQDDEMHENEAVLAMARALAGDGVGMKDEPHEGKIDLIAEKDGLLKVDRDALLGFNMLGEVMCATVHDNTVVKRGQIIAGTRAIPLVVKRHIVERSVRIAEEARAILSIREMRRPKAGIVITGNEVYYGRIRDAFEPVIRRKIEDLRGEVSAVYFAPDDARVIEERIRDLISAGVDLIITTGGMSVDPDDVTRFAVRNAGAEELYYGTPVLPGSMFLVAYIKKEKGPASRGINVIPGHVTVPVLGMPACGMFSSITVFDLILPRILAGEKIGRRELAELGHGGMCLKCETCRYPVCPFGK